MKLTPLILLGPLALVACTDDAPRSSDADVSTPSDVDVSTPSDADVSTPSDADASTPSDTDATAPELTPEEALTETIATLCPGYAELFCAADCGCEDAPGFPEDCKAAFAASCAARLEGFLPLVERGEAVFLPDGAAGCLEAFAPLASACLAFPNDLFFFVCPILAPPEGFPPFPGLGESCQGVCQTGLRCGTAGKCVEPGAVGAACITGFDCATTLVCVDETCAAPRHDEIGKSCGGPSDCGGDTACLASVRKVCVERVSGSECRWDEDCPATEWCDTSGGDTGVCKPGGAEGEPCGNGVVCQSGLACDFMSGDCAPIPSSGQPCALGLFGPFVCADGLACNEGTCGTPPGDGEPCAFGTPACAAGLGCAFERDGSVCRPKVGEGGYCENDDTCQAGHFCDFGANSCTSFMIEGERCTDGNECGPAGACLPDEAFVFRCAKAGDVGDECFLDDCSGDLRCKTPYTAGVCAPVLCEMLRF